MSDTEVWRWLQQLQAEKRKRALLENTLLTVLVAAGIVSVVIGGSFIGLPS